MKQLFIAVSLAALLAAPLSLAGAKGVEVTAKAVNDHRSVGVYELIDAEVFMPSEIEFEISADTVHEDENEARYEGNVMLSFSHHRFSADSAVLIKTTDGHVFKADRLVDVDAAQ